MTTEYYLVEYCDPGWLYDNFSGHVQFTETFMKGEMLVLENQPMGEVNPTL